MNAVCAPLPRHFDDAEADIEASEAAERAPRAADAALPFLAQAFALMPPTRTFNAILEGAAKAVLVQAQAVRSEVWHDHNDEGRREEQHEAAMARLGIDWSDE